MKTTLELPDDLMRRIKVRAAESDRKLKDTVEELIRIGLDGAESMASTNPLQNLRQHLFTLADGTIVNGAGISDPEFFASLEEFRNRSRHESLSDPLS
jgi:plasmid stability protein